MQKVGLNPFFFYKIKRKNVLTLIQQVSLMGKLSHSVLVCCVPFRLFLGKTKKPYEGRQHCLQVNKSPVHKLLLLPISRYFILKGRFPCLTKKQIAEK